MTEIPLPLSVHMQELLNYDHRGFVNSMELNDSSENNLKELIKLTDYYRQVLPVNVLVSQNIQAHSISVLNKYNKYKDDVNRLKSVMDSTISDFECLLNKATEAKEKQLNLISRLECLVPIIISNGRPMSFEEIRYQNTLKHLNVKVNSLQVEMDDINSKLAVASKYSDMHISNKKSYFQDWQIDLVKKNLSLMSDSIQKLFDEISVTKEALDTHDMV